MQSMPVMGMYRVMSRYLQLIMAGASALHSIESPNPNRHMGDKETIGCALKCCNALASEIYVGICAAAGRGTRLCLHPSRNRGLSPIPLLSTAHERMSSRTEFRSMFRAVTHQRRQQL